jgi:hypothetical protein
VAARYTVADMDLDPATLPDYWQESDGRLASAFIRANKPLAAQDVPQRKQTSAPVVVASSSDCCGGGCCN